MELGDFVDRALKQVIAGVKSAQAWAEEVGAVINPATISRSGDKGLLYFDSKTGRPAEFINFEISVSTIEGDELKGGGGVFAGIVNFGTGAISEKSKAEVGKINFSVPVLFPNSEVD